MQSPKDPTRIKADNRFQLIGVQDAIHPVQIDDIAGRKLHVGVKTVAIETEKRGLVWLGNEPTIRGGTQRECRVLPGLAREV